MLVTPAFTLFGGVGFSNPTFHVSNYVGFENLTPR